MIDSGKNQNQQGRYATAKSSLRALLRPEEQTLDLRTHLLRAGAHEPIAPAIEAGLQVLLESHAVHRLPDGREGVVCNGYLSERTVHTGTGALGFWKALSRAISRVHKTERPTRSNQRSRPLVCGPMKLWLSSAV